MVRERNWAWIVIGCVGALYALGVLPKLSFRHDDWWILGNSVRYLPTDWGFLFRPTLYFEGAEITWFFRPGFKFLVWLFYDIAGLHYAAWMGALLVLFLACLKLGYEIACRVTEEPRHGLFFVVTLGASLAIHFGSLAWMGEGIMNIPQVFLLLLCTYAVAESILTDSAVWRMVSWLTFALALGFKESSLFHVAFLAAFVFEPRLRQSPRERWLTLAPFALFASAYLVIRLGVMPVNPSYLAKPTIGKVFRSLSTAMGPLFLPLALWIFVLRVREPKALGAFFRGLAGRWRYLPFLAVSLSIYVGHDFFSPGWFLLLGTFTLLALSLGPLPAFSPQQAMAFAGLLLVFSSVPIVGRLESMGWWQWKGAQEKAFEIVRSAPAETESLVVRACNDPRYPMVTFERVVANEEGLRQMWFLTHRRDIDVSLVRCETPIQPEPGRFLVDWRFPEIRLINER